jgi:hypothetical protein
LWWTAGIRCWSDPIDDRCAFWIHLDVIDQRANQLPSLIPVEIIETASNRLGETLQLADDLLHGLVLRDVMLRVVELLFDTVHQRANALSTRAEVVEIDQSSFVDVQQSLEALLLCAGNSLELRRVCFEFVLRFIVDSAASPFSQYTIRVL